MSAPPVLDVHPDRKRARELARRFSVVPVSYSFVEDTETPVSAYLKLRGTGPSFLLESAEQGRLGRYSFLGLRPHALLRWSHGRLSEWSHNDVARAAAGSPPRGEPTSSWAAPDPYGAVSAYLDRYRLATPGPLPPFPGGAVGYFGYDLVRTTEPLGAPNPDPIGLPDMALMICDVLLAFDHFRHELAVISHMFVRGADDVDAAYSRSLATIDEVRQRLRDPVPRHRARPGSSEPVEFRSNMTAERFQAVVRRVIEYIRAGDAFQVVPSQRFTAAAPVQAFSIYRGLRAVNPSPYMYFLDFGDVEIAGASPEPLVKVSGRRVETRPIAGTYPRGGSDEEDRRRADELLRDPKERAEHIMLVDLGRNDLGRVCEYGSVTVDELMSVETYSHVLHIVSRVSGRLREGISAMDALRAVLPAGTLSGAPKVRAMQIIDELEPHKRGSYGGAIGYVSFTGDVDAAIHIRTVVVKDGLVHVQAGAGTVADARPDSEYKESLAKAEAIFRAVQVAADQPEWS